MRKCDNCKYEFGEWCTHPEIEKERRSNPPSTNLVGDLWEYNNETPSWCPERRDGYVPSESQWPPLG